MKVLVTGAGGMLGRAVVKEFTEKGVEIVALTHSDLDISNREAVYAVLGRDRPDYVINCAALTDVDGCESDVSENIPVNTLGPGNLALASRAIGAGLLTVSTDYVFDGRKDGFYTQRDTPNPLNAYGRAKLHGERLAAVSNARTIVARVGWMFDAGGRNFLSKIPRLIANGEAFEAINDNFGTPTYAPHAALRLLELAMRDIPGTYHIANSGDGTSYAGFAGEIAAGARMTEVSADSLARPAARPQNSRLRCLMETAIGLEPLPDWKDAVKDFTEASASGSAVA